MENTVKRDDLLLRLYDRKVSKDNLDQRVSELDVFVKAITVSVEELEKNLCSLQEETWLLL